MADSDDEHDRSRSRDKFRRERSDYGDKSRSRGGYREKRTWRDDDSSRRRSRDDGDRDRRRYSPSRGRDWSPPPKRMRREGWCVCMRERGGGNEQNLDGLPGSPEKNGTAKL